MYRTKIRATSCRVARLVVLALMVPAVGAAQAIDSIQPENEHPADSLLWLARFRAAVGNELQSYGPVAASQEDAHAAQLRGNAARRGLPDPQLTVGLSALGTSLDPAKEPMTRAPFVSVRQMIPNRRSATAKGEAAAQMESVASASANLLEQGHGLAMAMAVLNHSYIEQDQALISGQKEAFDALLASLQTRYQVGRIAAFEVDSIEVEKGLLDVASQRLVREAEIAKSEWRARTDVAMPVLTQQDLLQQAQDIAQIIAGADVNQFPEVASARARIQALQAKSRAKQRDGGLDWSVGVEYGVRVANRDDMLGANVGVNLPVWNQRALGPEVEALEAEIAGAQKLEEAAKARNQAQMHRSQEVIDSLVIQAAQLHDALLPAADRAVRSATLAYETGRESLTTVTRLHNRLLELRRTNLATWVEIRREEARLLSLMGKLLDTRSTTRTEEVR